MTESLYLSPSREAYEAYVAKNDLKAGTVKWCSTLNDLYGWSNKKIIMGHEHWLLPPAVLDVAKIIGVAGGVEYEVEVTDFEQ